MGPRLSHTVGGTCARAGPKDLSCVVLDLESWGRNGRRDKRVRTSHRPRLPNPELSDSTFKFVSVCVVPFVEVGGHLTGMSSLPLSYLDNPNLLFFFFFITDYRKKRARSKLESPLFLNCVLGCSGERTRHEPGSFSTLVFARNIPVTVVPGWTN